MDRWPNISYQQYICRWVGNHYLFHTILLVRKNEEIQYNTILLVWIGRETLYCKHYFVSVDWYVGKHYIVNSILLKRIGCKTLSPLLQTEQDVLFYLTIYDAFDKTERLLKILMAQWYFTKLRKSLTTNIFRSFSFPLLGSVKVFFMSTVLFKLTS